MNLFVFGLGYSALHYAIAQGKRFDRIAGTVTDPLKQQRLAEAGVSAYLFSRDSCDPEIADALAQSDVLIVSIPPDENGDPALMKHALALARARRLRSIVYLSTVGVYGDRGGAWVDETTPSITTNRRSLMRLAAENLWRALARAEGRDLYVLRLAGIYGPGRNAFVQLRNGTARRLIKPGQVFNRIHVEDIAQAIDKCLARSGHGDDIVLNIADGNPSPAQDVIVEAARIMGVEPPPETDFATAQLSEMARSFYSECKRVSIDLARREIVFSPIYPSYREGLAALWRQNEGR